MGKIFENSRTAIVSATAAIFKCWFQGLFLGDGWIWKIGLVIWFLFFFVAWQPFFRLSCENFCSFLWFSNLHFLSFSHSCGHHKPPPATQTHPHSPLPTCRVLLRFSSVFVCLWNHFRITSSASACDSFRWMHGFDLNLIRVWFEFDSSLIRVYPIINLKSFNLVPMFGCTINHTHEWTSILPA